MRSKVLLKRSIFTTAVASTVVLFWAVFSHAADLKVAYINSERILSDYKALAEVQQELDRYKDQWEKEAEKKQRELERLKEEYEVQRLLMSEEKRKELERDGEAKAQALQKFVDEFLSPGGKYAQKNIELSKPIYDEINSLIKNIGEEEDYDFIFDSPGLLFAKPQYDITDRILEELDKEIPTSKESQSE